MKQCYKLLFSLTIMALTASGCKQTDEEAVKDTLLLSTGSIAIAVEGGSRTIAVTSSGEWRATSPADWITLSFGEHQVTVVAAPNSGDIRSGEITIATATREAVVSVNQESATDASNLKVHYNPDKRTIDSQGGEFSATVIAAAAWNATIDNEHFTVHADRAANRLTVTAPKNEQETNRTAILSVSAAGSTERIILSQQTRAENPYYSLLGTWNWTAEKWFFGGDYPTKGTHASLRLEEKAYNSMYIIWDLFVKGGGMHVTYLPEKQAVHVPLGTSVGASPSLMFYLCACRIEGTSMAISFEGGLTFSASGGALTVTGSNSATYPYVGIIGYDGMNYMPFNDLYYAQTEGSTLAHAASGAPALTPAFPGITPNLGDIPRKRGYVTVELE